ncbi:phosphate/phosphite/phosphonate ABC transporter substrate-binding protein [Roseateles sp. BYS180W]|uniref:Phosphate/phosphite/phosphonate ABC transporter substrate-binding protein n=1 Tax=Roseateles rivi TaxID=3299028 RepID=A0ABW7FU63_9BURK
MCKGSMVRRRLLLAGALALSGTGLCAQTPEKTYYFSPVNQANIALMAEYWNPIIGYVSERSGVKLTLRLGRTSADTTAYVLAHEVDFVFSNHLFSPEREKLGWRVFGRRKTPPIHGQIIVPADSPVKDLAQLEGHDVAFPGPEALVAYKFTYAQLLARKVNVRVVFGGNMDGALAQLFSGKVAAVGANSQLAENFAQREGKAYRVLWSSEPLHDLALMVSSRVHENEVKAVARAFVNMHQDPKGLAILEAASKAVGLSAEAHFIPSDGSEYAAYRRFYQSAPPQLR